MVRRALLLAAALLPVAAGALEPRFDHRDAHGPVLGLLAAHDSSSAGGRARHAWRPAARLGWTVDVTGQGGELVLAADAALTSWHDPDRHAVLLAASARYRGYFGTEEWKTYFEAGISAPLQSRLGAGPLVGLGLVYDFSQDVGVFAGAEFASSFGGERVVSFAGLAGWQYRFAIP